MRRKQELPAAARKLMTAQHGVITTSQLAGCGLSERVIERLTAGWQRVSRGIHLAQVATWQSAPWAGLLRGGGDAVVGGLAACFLEKAVRDAPATVLLWVPEHRTGFAVGDWRVTFRRGSPPAHGVKEPPRTEIHESLLDVAATSDERDTVATSATPSRRSPARSPGVSPSRAGCSRRWASGSSSGIGKRSRRSVTRRRRASTA